MRVLREKIGAAAPNNLAGSAPKPNNLADSAPAKSREWETERRTGVVVRKDHPAIVFRGALDTLNALMLRVAIEAKERGERETAAAVEELYHRGLAIMRADALDEPLHSARLLGLTEDELREASHHPLAYAGVGHVTPSVEMPPMAASLNVMRAYIRQVEVAAVSAFVDAEGHAARGDILRALNRLSSAAYLVYLRVAAKAEEAR